MQIQRVLILILAGWFLVLCFGHYFDRRPLWNDELCVLDNIIKLKPHEIFSRPLLSDQAFPRLYLWSIQKLSRTIGLDLLVLRSLSLMAMLAAFFVWFKIARRVLPDPWDQALFTGAWSAAMPLVYYAAELKPYSMDVLASGLMVYLMIEQDRIKKDPRVYGAILFFLPLLGLFSYPAVFLILLPLYNLARESLVEKRWLPGLSFYLAGCLFMLSLNYLYDYRVSLRHLVEVYWHDYFISVDSLKAFLNSFGKGLNNLTSRPFAEYPRWVKLPSRIFIGLGLVFMLLRSWDGFKKDRYFLRSIVPITFAMFLLQIILAGLRIYPFAVPRLGLFFCPLLLLMTVIALRTINGSRKVQGAWLRTALAGYLLFLSLGIAWNVFIIRQLGARSTLYSEQHLHDGPG